VPSISVFKVDIPSFNAWLFSQDSWNQKPWVWPSCYLPLIMHLWQ
jgi:hypothetical protein